MELRNRFQGMNSASLCSLAGQYHNPLPTRFLAPIDCLKIPALVTKVGGIDSSESIPGLLKHLQIRAQATLASRIGYLESIPRLHKWRTKTNFDPVCFFRFDLTYFWNKPSSLRFDLLNLCNKQTSLRFDLSNSICSINRVCSASIFQICGINRIRFASIFLKWRISRVCFASIFTSSGIADSFRYRKRSQDRSFVPPSFQYCWHY